MDPVQDMAQLALFVDHEGRALDGEASCVHPLPYRKARRIFCILVHSVSDSNCTERPYLSRNVGMADAIVAADADHQCIDLAKSSSRSLNSFASIVHPGCHPWDRNTARCSCHVARSRLNICMSASASSNCGASVPACNCTTCNDMGSSRRGILTEFYFVPNDFAENIIVI